jgi:hypothetical protein
MITREQDFQEVRRLLRNPKEQRPSPDIIVSNLLKAEQLMLLRANGTGQAWSPTMIDITSEAGTAEYEIEPATGTQFGKALFAYRALPGSVLLPVPVTDFITEFSNQKYEFWIAPAGSGENPSFSGEKLAFFRVGSAIKMRIFPVPSEIKTYTVCYAYGMQDWTSFEWSDVPPMPEFSHFRQVIAALGALSACEWEGYDLATNAAFRRELNADLKDQYSMFDDQFGPWIRNTQNSPRVSEIGGFWE